MTTELLLPSRIAPAPKPPERIALNCAFGVGAGAVLGDKSRFNSHGVIVGAAWAAGLHGMCLDFNPVALDNVRIPATATQFDFGANNFSAIVRINVDDLTGRRTIFQRGSSAVAGWLWLIDTTGDVWVETDQAAAWQITESAAGDIVVGNWYTVGFSRVAAAINIFVNGIDTTAVPRVHISPLPDARPSYIGYCLNDIAFPFDGRIEFFRIFKNVALQPSEHLAWHNALA